MFKKGDNVKCINADGEMYILNDEIYEVVDFLKGVNLLGIKTIAGVRLYNEGRFIVTNESIKKKKIFRKIKDLDGFENGIGLRLRTRDPGFKGVWLGDVQIYKIHDTQTTNSILDIVKSMGFKFDWEPLRSLEEVFEEMKVNSLAPFITYDFPTYGICGGLKCGGFSVVATQTFGVATLTFKLEVAEKYVNELNEIIKEKKEVL